MTFTSEGARFRKRTRNPWLLPVVIGIEAVLSFFLYISFAAHTLWPEDTEAAVGVASVLSYEGRLMDASGNPLGGTGTAYCFRFSIYDSATGGTKLWPAGTPTNSLATSTDGVFSALIGQADALTYNFYDSDTVFLNVDVNTTPVTCAGSWESLSPRQRIGATGYAQSAKSTYGGAVQVGTGIGGGSISLLALDVKNTADYIGLSCATSGTVWYNSAISKALVCENGVIQAISNSSATTTLAAINANAGTPATTGTIVFSNSNGVTFGINGNTITASVAPGGGGGNTYSSTVIGNDRGWAQGSLSLGQNSLYFVPQILPDSISAVAVKMPVMVTNSSIGSSSGDVGYTARFAIYTTNATNATVLSLHYSTSWTLRVSNSSNVSRGASYITGIGNSTSYNSLTSTSAGLNLSSLLHGPREVIMPVSSVLTPGMYWFAFANSSSLVGGTSNSVLAMSYIVASSQTGARFGNATSATSGPGIAKDIGLGTYSATSGAFPGGVSLTQINKLGTNPIYYIVDATQ